MCKSIDDLTIEDLNEEQSQLAELIGLDTYKILVRHYAGNRIYIPKGMHQMVERNQTIREAYKAGVSIRRLTREYGLCDSRIRQIVSGSGRQPFEGQISMDEYYRP